MYERDKQSKQSGGVIFRNCCVVPSYAVAVVAWRFGHYSLLLTLKGDVCEAEIKWEILDHFKSHLGNFPFHPTNKRQTPQHTATAKSRARSGHGAR